MQYKVTLWSEVYGTEEFLYDTEREAWAGVRRLTHSTKRQYKKDGIVRHISVPMPVKSEGRQDEVDNAVFNLIQELAPEGVVLEWDIEHISLVRDAIAKVLVDKLQVMTNEEFYP